MPAETEDPKASLRDAVRKQVEDARIEMAEAVRVVDLALDLAWGRATTSRELSHSVSGRLAEARKASERAGRLLNRAVVEAQRAEEAGVDFAAEPVEYVVAEARRGASAAEKHFEQVIRSVYESAEAVQIGRGGTFSLADLRVEAERRGVGPELVDLSVARLREQGEVMEKKPGRWQLVRY